MEQRNKLISAFGPAGRENAIRDEIAAQITPYVQEMRVDAMGNLLAHIPGQGDRLLLAAHCDTVGFVVTYFEENGLLRVGVLGTLAQRELQALGSIPVVFENGTEGMLHLDADAMEKPAATKLYVDIGAKDAAEARQCVQLGDTAVWQMPSRMLGTRCNAPFAGSRAGCAALVEAVKRIHAPKHDIWIAFTVQEELGCRGAAPAAFSVEADAAVVVSPVLADDTPGAERTVGVKLGAGATIKILDGSMICAPELVRTMQRAAETKQLTVQPEASRSVKSEGGVIAATRSGVRMGGISIPTRFLHLPVEEVDTRDIECATELLVALAEME